VPTKAEVCRKYGISEQTYYRWRQLYGGLDVPHLRRLKHLEAENARLKHLVAEQMLAHETLKAERPTTATHRNHVWTYDFLFDRTDHGQTLKILTVLDEQKPRTGRPNNDHRTVLSGMLWILDLRRAQGAGHAD
jgi:hypothetical protein